MSAQENSESSEPPKAPAPTSNTAVAASDSDEESEKKCYTITQTLFENLLLNGFSENAIKKSIVAGCIDENTCTQWIKMHEGHPELDTPLEDGVEVTVKAKRVLTESEREEKVKELQKKIKQKREEEKLEALQKERDRIEMGRRALEMKEEMDTVRRKLEQEEVRRQKVADAAARKRIKIQIVADRYTRQGKGTEEAWKLAESEIEAEAEKARETAAARAKRLEEQQHDTVAFPAGTGPGAGGAEWNLASVVQDSSQENRLQSIFSADADAEAECSASTSPEAFVDAIKGLPGSEKCLEILRTVLANIVASPLDVKKRTLRTSTKAFSQNIKPFEPALQLLKSSGFSLGVDAEGSETIVCNTVVIWRLERMLTQLQNTS